MNHESRIAYDRIAERTNAFHRHPYPVAGLHGTDAGRCASTNNVTGLEGHDERDELHERVDGEDELPGVRGLLPVVVHPSLDAERGPVEAHGNARSERRERVESLRARVLDVLRLQVPRGHVVHAGQPEDDVARLARGHAAGATPDHDGQLRLVVHTAHAGRDPDRVVRPDHRCCRLEEHQRLLRQRLVHLACMILVVEADRHDFRGAHRGEKVECLSGDRSSRAIVTEDVAIEPVQGPVALDRVTAVRAIADSVNTIHVRSRYRAVSSTRFDSALQFGTGTRLSTATTAYTYRTPGVVLASR